MGEEYFIALTLAFGIINYAMKTIQYFTLLLLAAVCFACGNNTYYLKTDNAAGLEPGDPVLRQGVPIGEVEAVRFADRQVEIEIEVEEPMYEGQYFFVRRDKHGSEVELMRPKSSADELASGSTISSGTSSDFGVALGEALGEALALRDEALEKSRNGLGTRINERADNWEERIEERADNWAEGIEERAENWAERLEALGNALEHWGEKQEDKFDDLERKLQRWADEHEDEFSDFEEKLDRWAEDFEGDLEDIAEAMDRAADKHPVGSKEWKEAVRKALKK